MKQLNLTFLNDLNLQLRHKSWDFQIYSTPIFKPEHKNKFIILATGSGKKHTITNNTKIKMYK